MTPKKGSRKQPDAAAEEAPEQQPVAKAAKPEQPPAKEPVTAKKANDDGDSSDDDSSDEDIDIDAESAAKLMELEHDLQTSPTYEKHLEVGRRAGRTRQRVTLARGVGPTRPRRHAGSGIPARADACGMPHHDILCLAHQRAHCCPLGLCLPSTCPPCPDQPS
jgi:hypothetical protein